MGVYRRPVTRANYELLFLEFLEDNLLPGFRFKVPMMIVLDTLKSDDPSLRRVGETWMRCSLKSYLRYIHFSLAFITDLPQSPGSYTF